MKRTKKKILAIIMTVALVMQITALPIFASGDGSGTGATQVDNYADFIEAVEAGGTVKLTDNISSEGTVSSIDFADGTNINLNGFTLKLETSSTLSVSEGESLIIRNGYLDIQTTIGATKATIKIEKNASILLNEVIYTTNSSALFPESDASAVTVTNSTVSTTGTYGVGTNASTNTKVIITLSNSTFETSVTDQDSTPVMMNVSGELSIDNCIINGYRQGLMIRGGTAEVTDTTINILADAGHSEKYLDDTWGGGNEVPQAAVVIGNRHGSSYAYPTTATFTNVTINNSYGTDIYMWGNTETNNATLEMYGVLYDEFIIGGETIITAYGGTYSVNPVDYVPGGYAIVKNSDGTYTVSLVEDAVVETTTSGTASATVNPTLSDDTANAVFTEEELAAGNELKVVLTADEIDVDTIDETEKTAIEEAIISLSEEGVFAFALDLSLEKFINDESAGYVTDANGMITITIDIPEEYQADGRVFSIIRVHDGVAEILEDLDDDPTTITFQTDKFSTYGFAYVDTEAADDVITVPDGYSVDTGDSTPYLPIGLLIVAMLGMATMVVRRRIQDNK